MYDREATNREQLATMTDRLLIGGRPRRLALADGTGALPNRPAKFPRGSMVEIAKSPPKRPSPAILLLGGLLTSIAAVFGYLIAVAVTP